MAAKVIPWQEQKSKLYPLLNKELKKGDEWFIIDKEWLSGWLNYIGIDNSDGGNKLIGGIETNNPGCINNQNLIDSEQNLNDKYGHNLKKNLNENLDYSFVPKELWDILRKIYGLSNGQKPICRYVIEVGEAGNLRIEVHLLRIRLSKIEDYTNTRKSIERFYSCKTSISHINHDAIKELSKENSKFKSRMWLKGSKWVLLKEKKCIDQYGLGDNEILYLELSKNSFKHDSHPDINFEENGVDEEPMDESDDHDNEAYEEMSLVGHCGLSNMGNTCFMNSALQCLVSVKPLSYYFTSNKWKKDLNENNPLGMKGLVAKAYADLVKEMHSLKSARQMHSLVPRQFKIAVSRFAPQFSGWAQHDSQELLAFLLDGLHEDLNRVRQKPYIEIKENDGRPDSIVASDCWKDYIKRNDSIIVETFHGQLKSTLICPQCNHISVTFDPFCYLGLPLPQLRNRRLVVTLLRKNPKSVPTEIRVNVEKQGRIFHLCDAIARSTNKRKLGFDINDGELCADNLIVADVHNSHIAKIFFPNDSISLIYDRDDIYVFELNALDKGTPRDGYKVVGVYERTPIINSYHKNFKTVGRPAIIAVPIDISYKDLLETILVRFIRYIDRSEAKKGQYYLNKKLQHENDDEDDDDIDHNSNDESEDPFQLRLVNMYGNAQVDEVKEDKPLRQNSNVQYVSLDWDSEDARNVFVSQEKERYVIKEESLQNISEKEVQLNDCLELFTNTEKLSVTDPWYCPKCKKHQEATKKLDLWSLPDILVIHLKRFTYSRWWRDKLDSRIDFPSKGLNLKPFVLDPSIKEDECIYDLLAVSNHFGGMGGGHYTAYARRGNLWLNLDDSSVSRLKEEDIVSRSAYVLFYERRQSKVAKRLSLNSH